MKRWFRTLWALVRTTFVCALAAIVVVDLYCEVVGVPPAARDTIERLLANHGFHARVLHVKFGLVRGLVVEGVSLNTDDRPGGRLLEAEEVRVSLNARSLLRGDLLPCRVVVSGGTLRVPRFTGAELGGTLLAAQDVNGRFSCDQASLGVSRLSGVVEGVRIELSGELAWPTGTGVGDSMPATTSLGELLRRFVQARGSDIEAVLAQVRGLHLSDGNAFLDAHIDGDVSRLAQARIAGRVRLTDVTARGVVVNRVLATFQYADGAWRLQNGQLLTDQNGLVEGEVAFWPGARQFEGRLVGALPLSVVRTWAGGEQTWIPVELDSERPVQFSLVLQRSPWQWRECKAELTCRATACRFRDLWIKSVSGTLSYADGRLDADAFEISVGRAAPEVLTGRASWWLDEKQVSGQFRGSCSLLLRGIEMGIVPAGLASELKLGLTPADVEFTLERSPYGWREWRGCGSARVPGGQVGRYRVGNVAGAVNLDRGVLAVGGLTLDWASPCVGGVDGALTLDFTKSPALDAVTLKFEAGLRAGAAPPAASAEGDGVFHCAGELTLRPGARRAQGRIAGRLSPVRAYEMLREPLCLPAVAALSEIHVLGPNPEFSLELPDTPWTLEGWELNGQAAFRDAVYRNIHFTRGSGAVELNSRWIRFRGLTGEEKDGTKVSLDLGVDFDPVAVSISGVYTGDPCHIVNFIYDDVGQQVYRTIWEGFQWQAAAPPELTVDAFRVDVWPGKGGWALTMRSHLRVADAAYRGVNAECIEMDVNLDLPQRVTLDNVRVLRGGDVTRGLLRIQIEGLTTYEFDIDGTLDPRELLRAIEPGLEQALSDFDFAPGTRIDCKGSFFHSREPMLRLSGTVTAPSLAFRKLRVSDLEGDWQVAESTVRWNVRKAALHGGRLAMRGFFDTASGAGVLAVDASGIDLSGLTADFAIGGTEAERVTEGKLNGFCQVQILEGWAGQPLQVTGNGHVRISEGDLWNIPFLYQLGRVLDLTLLSRLSKGRVGGIGRISVLQADIEFKGRKLLIPQLLTDGTFLSLTGNGEYNWQTQALNLNVKGVPLRQVGVLSLALSPLSWMFDAELTGTLDEHEWRMKTALQRAFSGKDGPDAPEAPPPP